MSEIRERCKQCGWPMPRVMFMCTFATKTDIEQPKLTVLVTCPVCDAKYRAVDLDITMHNLPTDAKWERDFN